MAQDELFGLRWVVRVHVIFSLLVVLVAMVKLKVRSCSYPLQWVRQHRRLEWVKLCAAMAKRGLVYSQLSLGALRSLLLVISQLHAMHVRAKSCGPSNSTPSDDEGGLPDRGEAEKTVQRIEEEMLDLVLMLSTLQRDHLVEWRGLLHDSTASPGNDADIDQCAHHHVPPSEDDDARRLLERSLKQVVAFSSDARLCARAQPALTEAAGTSAQLLASTI
jgi:hypothetical protein